MNLENGRGLRGIASAAIWTDIAGIHIGKFQGCFHLAVNSTLRHQHLGTGGQINCRTTQIVIICTGITIINCRMIMAEQVDDGQLIAVLVQNANDLVGVNIVAAPGVFATNSIVQRYMGSNKNGAVITIGNFLFKICPQCINSRRNCTICIAAIVGISLFPREVVLVENKDTEMLRVIGTKGVQTNGVIRIVVTLNIDNLIVSSVVIEVGCKSKSIIGIGEDIMNTCNASIILFHIN